MHNDISTVVLGILTSLILVTIIAGILQKFLVSRRYSNPHHKIDDHESLDPILSAKLRLNSGLCHYSYVIKALLVISDSEDRILMLDPEVGSSNVVRCRPDGTIVWVAELPGGNDDVYTELDWGKDTLYAFSWHCFSVTLDIMTGKLITSVFTK